MQLSLQPPEPHYPPRGGPQDPRPESHPHPGGFAAAGDLSPVKNSTLGSSLPWGQGLGEGFLSSLLGTRARAGGPVQTLHSAHEARIRAQVTREHTGGPGRGHLVLPLTPTRHAEPSASEAQGPLQQRPPLSGTQSARRLRGSTRTHLQTATLPRVLVCSSPPRTREGVIGALSPAER